MNFLLGSSIETQIVLDDSEDRVQVEIGKHKTLTPVYIDGEAVKGQIILKTRDGRSLSHTGVRVQFIGKLDMLFDRSAAVDFISLAQDLVGAQSDVQSGAIYKFCFDNVQKAYESYKGLNVRLQYIVRVTIGQKGFTSDLVTDRELWVHHTKPQQPSLQPVKMEVGIEDALHIEFEYNQSAYHLKDVILGKIYFLLVRIKIRTMELSIVRRETASHAGQQHNEVETLTKFEIMDGSPVRGEAIPIRLYLAGFDLTPTLEDVAHKFSARYFLNLVLFDEENRRYFKQHEILLYRLEGGDS